MSSRLGTRRSQVAGRRSRGVSRARRVLFGVASSRHRDVVAYKAAAQFADEVSDAVQSWDRKEALWTIGVQLVRSSGSIGANIAEALGRGSRADGKRILFIARGSVLETEHWIDRARHAELVLPEGCEFKIQRIAQLLHGLIRSDRLHP
jgi:four helix bundle protein